MMFYICFRSDLSDGEDITDSLAPFIVLKGHDTEVNYSTGVKEEYLGPVKQKSAFEHLQKFSQIQIIL